MAVKIKMLEDTKGSPDGIQVNMYKAGETYEVDSSKMPRSLAKVFVDEMKVAEAFDETASPAKATKTGPAETK